MSRVHPCIHHITRVTVLLSVKDDTLPSEIFFAGCFSRLWGGRVQPSSDTVRLWKMSRRAPTTETPPFPLCVCCAPFLFRREKKSSRKTFPWGCVVLSPRVLYGISAARDAYLRSCIQCCKKIVSQFRHIPPGSNPNGVKSTPWPEPLAT